MRPAKVDLVSHLWACFGNGRQQGAEVEDGGRAILVKDFQHGWKTAQVTFDEGQAGFDLGLEVGETGQAYLFWVAIKNHDVIAILRQGLHQIGAEKPPPPVTRMVFMLLHSMEFSLLILRYVSVSLRCMQAGSALSPAGSPEPPAKMFFPAALLATLEGPVDHVVLEVQIFLPAAA